MTNKTAVIYYNIDGKISLTGTLSEELVESWAQANVNNDTSYLITDDSVDPSQYYVVNNVITPLPQGTLTDNQWNIVRLQRDRLLAETDWHVIKATETAQPIPQDWANYRQALRDVTNQPDPFNILWPVPPDSSGFNPEV